MILNRKTAGVYKDRWQRYKYNICSPLGENGQRISASKEHIDLARRAAQEGAVLLKNNGTLPIKKKSKIALFGIASLDYLCGGGGSGFVYSAKNAPDLYEAFYEKDVEIYKPVLDFYLEYAAPLLKDLEIENSLNDPDVPIEVIKDAAQNNDVAIITLHRFSGENYDRVYDFCKFELSKNEINLLNQVSEEFKKTVVVLNFCGMTDISIIKENDNIDACIYAGLNGMEGPFAIADIIMGEVNPSGKLTDTFAKSIDSYPQGSSFLDSKDYVCYYEDIYVGYRYFETIKDKQKDVLYPFGFGLSYTDFEITEQSSNIIDNKFTTNIIVKNIGNYSGKEVVQIYYSAPQGLLYKSKISLAAFKKTKLLKPNEQEVLTLEFDINDMASFDDLGKIQKSAYLLEKGDYEFFVGNSCRNLTKLSYSLFVKENKITKQVSSCCAPINLEKRLLSNGEFEALNSAEIKEYNGSYGINAKNRELPEKLTIYDVINKKVTIDEFVSTIELEDLMTLMGGTANRGLSNVSGIGGLDKYDIPAIMFTDGPAGLRINRGTNIATTCFPSATTVASSWNTELSYEIGKAGGLEAKECALGVWLTPGVNIHRNPLCGRNFEYFSEDPLISGEFAAAQINGIQSVGTAATIKHFICNEKEVNRYYSDSRISERALREIYLKPFEIAIKNACPHSLMTSYNIVNGVRACENYELITTLLREELGFKGLVMSDWGVPCNQYKLTIAGNDLKMPAGNVLELKEAFNSGKLKRSHLEVCAKRIIEFILKFD